MNRLKKSYFERDPITLARDLIGCRFVRIIDGIEIVGEITETEAYGDATDLASHARFGETKRNNVMFHDEGILYIYQIYGIFYLTNIVAGPTGKPGAVLIRSAQIIKGMERAQEMTNQSKFVKANKDLAIGPGKFSLAFGMNKAVNGISLTDSSTVFIEAKEGTPDIIESKRIGVDYAGKSANLRWRFYNANNEAVSKR